MTWIHPQETDMNRIDPLRATAACAAATLDPDFERNPRIHRAWEIRGF